jgi:general secretion pathway protein C
LAALPSFAIFGKPRGGRRIALGGWLVLSLATLCIALLANLFWTIIGPAGSVGNWKARVPATISPSGRVALYSAFDPFSRSIATSGDEVTVTSLSLILFGTRVNENSGSGSAILAGADGVQQSYAVGEEVLPGVTLSAVAFDHVVLARNGVKESLFIDQSVPAETVGAQAAPSAAAAPMANASGEVRLNSSTLRDAIGVAPRNEGGRITGLVLSAKDDGAMLRNAGLTAGDIVVSINGRPVGSAADIAAQLRPGAKLTLEVERGAQKIPVGLNLE